jgi:hypothetical protein
MLVASPIMSWTDDELTRVGDAQELDIQSRRRDDTLRTPRIVWVVRHGDDLYVRSVNGRDSAWFRGVRTRWQGHIEAGGVGRDVAFVDVDDEQLSDELDDVYRTKYGRYPGPVERIISPQARAATLRVDPAEAS